MRLSAEDKYRWFVGKAGPPARGENSRVRDECILPGETTCKGSRLRRYTKQRSNNQYEVKYHQGKGE